MNALTAEIVNSKPDRIERTFYNSIHNEHRSALTLKNPGIFEAIQGHSKVVERVIGLLDQIRSTDITVLIEGETGTGKELAARALHRGGERRNKPFIALNCAGLSETLIQSALFGHKKGSYTGAYCDNPGAFKEANGGTLLLDEVSDLPRETQGNLLRVLQEHEITPIGTVRPTKVDVRIISTSNKNLLELVQAGQFRQDLYFRLVIAHIIMPPLRIRHGDIPYLAHRFLERYNRTYDKRIRGFTPEAIEALERYSWPGNVRELEHEVERAVVLAHQDQLIPLKLLTPILRTTLKQSSSHLLPESEDFFTIPSDLPYDEALDMLKRRLLIKALRETSGVKAHAAKLLGIQRTRLTKLQKRLGLNGKKA